MAETEVVIEFACCHCQQPVFAKLRCSGEGINQGPHAVAGVQLPCPTCDRTSHVCFELSGLVLQVAPERKGQAVLEPSLN